PGRRRLVLVGRAPHPHGQRAHHQRGRGTSRRSCHSHGSPPSHGSQHANRAAVPGILRCCYALHPAGRALRSADPLEVRPVLDERARRRQRARNAVQGLLLLGGMVVALAVVAGMVLGGRGLLWVAVLGVLVVVARPKVPTSWVLSMYGAKQLPPQAAPELHLIVQALSERAGLASPPRIHYVPSPMANAFVVGHGDDAALAVTDGLLRNLTGRQVAGVLAHEIAHLRAGDTAIMSLSDAVSRLVQGLSYLGLFTLFLTVPLA